MEDIKEESKDWFLKILRQYNEPLFLILLGIVSIVLLVFAFNSYGKNYVTKLINGFVEQQVKLIDKNYIEQLKTRDDQIQNLQTRISVSEKKYVDINKRVNDVEIKIKGNKPPATSVELRTRFNDLGFKPVN